MLRPMLLLGAERELILALGIVAGVFIVSLFQLWAAIFGLMLWAVSGSLKNAGLNASLQGDLWLISVGSQP